VQGKPNRQKGHSCDRGGGSFLVIAKWVILSDFSHLTQMMKQINMLKIVPEYFMNIVTAESIITQ
jgi:hypothetical protein